MYKLKYFFIKNFCYFFIFIFIFNNSKYIDCFKNYFKKIYFSIMIPLSIYLTFEKKINNFFSLKNNCYSCKDRKSNTLCFFCRSKNKKLNK